MILSHFQLALHNTYKARLLRIIVIRVYQNLNILLARGMCELDPTILSTNLNNVSGSRFLERQIYLLLLDWQVKFSDVFFHTNE